MSEPSQNQRTAEGQVAQERYKFKIIKKRMAWHAGYIELDKANVEKGDRG